MLDVVTPSGVVGLMGSATFMLLPVTHQIYSIIMLTKFNHVLMSNNRDREPNE